MIQWSTEAGVLESSESKHQYPLTDDGVDSMIALAERLRAVNGGVLDDSAISAIAEATGAPTEYVRLAVKVRAEQERRSLVSQARAQYLTLDPDVRKYVVAGISGTLCAFLSVLEAYLKWLSEQHVLQYSYGIFGMVALVFLTLAIYTVGLARDGRVAAVAGAIFGGGYFALQAVFAAIFRLEATYPPFVLVPFTIGGAIAGLLLQAVVQKYRGSLGLKDPVKERQDLLRQLVDLQKKLEASEQHCTFVSLDIVGSTRMKNLADPLSVEFTFNEYHQFVERVTTKHGGRIHSTAGDGVICAFDQASQAFAAARNIQTGIIELNTFRNRIGTPIVLRASVHTGTVMTAQAGDITSVNFAHVIDIAAHLQKMAPPGGIVVSDAAAMSLPGGPAAVGTEKVQVDEVTATIWSPRPVAVSAVAAPPPVPDRA